MASHCRLRKTLTFGGTITGGTFTLALNGVTTAAITYSATANTLQSNIQQAINAAGTPFGGLSYQSIGDHGAMIAGATSTGVPTPPGRRVRAHA